MKARLPGPEEVIHKSVVRYLRTVLPHGWMVHHSRNGGLSKAENGRAKGMGAVAGYPDIEVLGHVLVGEEGRAVPTSYFFEVKAPRGSLSSDQRAVHDQLKDIGFPVYVVRSIDDTRRAVEAMGLPTREVRS